MDSDQLSDALNNNPLTKDHFGGVYSSDEIPWQEMRKAHHISRCFIFNLDKSNEPGSHWVCIILRKQNEGGNIYFDSYGMLPFFDSFEKFMSNCFSYNHYQLQHNFSTACGQWCLYMIYHILSCFPFNLILEGFNNDDKLVNDYICNHFVKRFFNIKPKVVARDFLKGQLDLENNDQKGGFLKKRKCQTCQPLYMNVPAINLS